MAIGVRMKAGDATAVKLLLALGFMFSMMAALAYCIHNMKHVRPLPMDAPLDRFSEARAVEHVRHLSKEIQGRQEGSPGLLQAAHYIKARLEAIAARAGSNYSIEIDESVVDGSFSMYFLGHSITFGYRKHTNIAMRIASEYSKDTNPSVLVNAHFDGPLGSPGAGDCASCVASLLELARLIVDSSWIPPQPIIFLFNGAEELFLLGSHGFTKTHKWRDSVGAFINIEASGTGGFDLVCQSGPGPWASLIYAQSAVYPMANSAAQDVFPIIPGDTDYRIFAEDYGDIPGLDIIFVLGGYFYHTSYDTVERLFPGSIQARGENLFSLVKAFTSSSKLQTAMQRKLLRVGQNETIEEQAVFFDYLSLFMVFYSGKTVLVLHSLPMIMFLSMPFFLCHGDMRVEGFFSVFCQLFKGMLFHVFGVLLAVIVPVVFAICRLLFSGYAMSWFAHPWLAFLMFIPSSLIGLLIPRIISSDPSSRAISASKSSTMGLSNTIRFWGAFGYYSSLTSAYQAFGLHGGFLTLMISIFMFMGWISHRLSIRSFGQNSLRSLAGYVITLIPLLLYSVYFGGFLVQFLIEKMGMMGSLPPPYGYFVPDVIIAATIGVVTGWCMGPLVPLIGHLLARSFVIQCCLHLSVAAMALSSQFFPYSTSAPKRVVLQHTYKTADVNRVEDSSYDFAVVDSNSLPFLFKYSPKAANLLEVGSQLSAENSFPSNQDELVALFPVSYLLYGGVKFHTKEDNIFKHYTHLPYLFSNKPTEHYNPVSRRIYLELYLGSLQEVWVSVLNITGPLSRWSFADNTVPDPERINGGPPSYICRLSGRGDQNWTFWLEANSSESLRVDLAVADQYLGDATRKLKGAFPDWVDVVAYSSYLSSYFF
ncbi:uncharacterized protein LOC116251263 [Nymphaea colorata]|nr:uncharacterized protein LOC116251263 [Nymphaea colorata]